MCAGQTVTAQDAQRSRQSFDRKASATILTRVWEPDAISVGMKYVGMYLNVGVGIVNRVDMEVRESKRRLGLPFVAAPEVNEPANERQLRHTSAQLHSRSLP